MTSVFHYKALKGDGKTIEGEIEAADKVTATAQLQSQGYYPVSINESSQQSPLFSLSLFSSPSNTLTHKQTLALTQQLSTLLEAGLTLDHALRNLHKSSSNTRVTHLLSSLKTDIQNGISLSSALSQHSNSFDSVYIAIVRSGEASGSLSSAFKRLSTHLEKSEALRSSFFSALLYPAILLSLSLLSLIFLLSFVIPKFAPMFSDSENLLPFISRMVFATSAIFQAYWWAAPILIASIVIFLRTSTKNHNKGLTLQLKLLKLPLIGTVIKSNLTAVFSRTMSTLLQNGLNPVESLILTNAAITNPVFKLEINQAIDNVKFGKGVSTAFYNSKILPELAFDLIKLGEDTGQLSPMFTKAADLYENETDQQLKRLLVFLEPILILGLGVLIAIIILSVLMAMLSLNDLVI